MPQFCCWGFPLGGGDGGLGVTSLLKPGRIGVGNASYLSTLGNMSGRFTPPINWHLVDFVWAGGA
ncbi:MAG TPA: hypothetical protein VH107_15780 [Lacipirellulaceae bacterium]|nr:hypothetical protein [Lacipirellulaceae bacterium]